MASMTLGEAVAAIERLEKERDEALEALRPHVNPDTKSSLADGIRNLAQAYVSERDNAATLERDNAALREQAQHQLEVIGAARDAIVGFQHQLGYLPQQGAYSTAMTEGERKAAEAIAALDAILKDAALSPARAPIEPPDMDYMNAVVEDVKAGKLGRQPGDVAPIVPAAPEKERSMEEFVIVTHVPGSAYCVFWRPNSCGYTSRLDEAGRYSEEEARRIEQIRSEPSAPGFQYAAPRLDRAFRLSEVERHAVRVVPVEFYR